MTPEESASLGDTALPREDRAPMLLSRVFIVYAVIASVLTLGLLFVRACDDMASTRYAVPDIAARKAALTATDR